MFKIFVKIITTLEFLIFTIAFTFLWIFNEFNKQVGFTLAHITGFITFIILLAATIFAFKNAKYITPMDFIICSISLILMMLGYFLFVFEGLSPIIHAGTSLNFDFATSGTAIAITCFINAIKEYKK